MGRATVLNFIRRQMNDETPEKDKVRRKTLDFITSFFKER